MKFKHSLFIIPLYFFLSSFLIIKGETLTSLRDSFFVINEDLNKAQEIYDRALKSESKSVVFKAYIGALQAMLASNQINPFSKLTWFNKGKSTIEKALKISPDNPEIHFLRLSIQLKAPSFLFYYSDVEADKAYVIDHINYFKLLGTLDKVKLFLIENGSLTIEEINKLKKN
jgi:hypothetical protein